jgi:rhodanese-related sulfurtransferase
LEKSRFLLILSVILLLLALGTGGPGAVSPVLAAGGKTELAGVLLDKSYKAKLLSLLVGDKTILVHYNEQTEGLDEVAKGDNVLLRYRGEGQRKMAIEVSPNLVKIPAGVQEVEIEEVLDLVNDQAQAGKYLLVDCRSADLYGEAHLPTSVSIPWTETKKVKSASLPVDKDRLLIFYCLGSTCLLGPNSAALAQEAGHKNVKVLLAELSEWQESGGQLYSADDYVANGNVVLVDLRSRQEAEAGYIPGAVNIPADDISEAEYDFPAKKSAPVIVYGENNDPVAVVEVIKGWGFHQVSMIEGGYDGWIKRGNPVIAGNLPFLIKWQRRLGEGEISLDDFQKVADGKSNVAVIIDVRTAEESEKGSFEKALRIPLPELETRLTEIPEDKEVYLHCATGARAKMAWTYLKQYREKVRFLRAKVVSRKGKIKISP